jgi:hypothetical protein
MMICCLEAKDNLKMCTLNFTVEKQVTFLNAWISLRGSEIDFTVLQLKDPGNYMRPSRSEMALSNFHSKQVLMLDGSIDRP